MSRSTIMKGTLILTITGFATRMIGFLYKIFLSNLIGAKNLGIYQLIFPVYGLCFTLYASGIQTAISKLTAEETGRGQPKNAKKILYCGIAVSVGIAAVLSVVIYSFSDFIAMRLLMEPECAASLRILSFIFPFCGVTACINGYYYGLKKAAVPAISQLFEQLVRVASVLLLVNILPLQSVEATCEIAVFGIGAGEIASQLFNTISLFVHKNKTENGRNQNFHPYQNLFKIAAPLTVNRLLLSLLHSFEAVLIPAMLRKSGLSPAEALSIYGIINGMVFPFIMFPSTITNSMSVLLMPAVSEANARNNHSVIAATVSISLKYSMILGIFSMGFFITFGQNLGMFVFKQPLAGSYLTILAWLCPFLYIATTLASIINGLGKINTLFLVSTSFLVLKIILLCVLIPVYGIRGFFISCLVSQVLMTLCEFILVKHFTGFQFDALGTILKPSILLAFCCAFYQKLFVFLQSEIRLNHLLLLLLSGVLLVLTFLLLAFATKTIAVKEFKQAA